MIESVCMLNISVGIDPIKLLLSRYSSSKFVRFPRVLGIVPLNLFDDTSK